MNTQYTSITSHISAKRIVGFNNIVGHNVGVAAALILADLEDQIDFFKEEAVHHEKYGSGWVYSTIENMQKRTCLTKHEQDTAIKKLVSLGLIEVNVFGMPPKRYFRINGDKINEMCGVKVTLLNCRKSEISKDNLENNDSSLESRIQNKSPNFPKTGNCFPENRKYGLINNTYKSDNNSEEIHAPTELDARVPDSFSSPKSPPKPKSPNIKPHANVEVTHEEHAKLVEKFGEEYVKEGYADLSEWKESAIPSVVAKHKSDYRRLRKWVIPALVKEGMEALKQKQANIAPHRRGSKMVTSGDYDDPSNFKIKRF